MIKHIDLKLGNMKKAQDFIVYPYKEGQTNLTIQSDKRIAEIDIATGAGRLSTKGSTFIHLSDFMGAIGITIDKDTVQKLLDIQPHSGDRIGGNVYVA